MLKTQEHAFNQHLGTKWFSICPKLRGIVCLYPAAKCHRKKAAMFAQYAEFQIGFNVATSLEILHTSF